MESLQFVWNIGTNDLQDAICSNIEVAIYWVLFLTTIVYFDYRTDISKAKVAGMMLYQGLNALRIVWWRNCGTGSAGLLMNLVRDFSQCFGQKVERK